ncbi:MAG: integrase [Rhodospirillaceae bacterium]|jgi:integron integrase|nr:integrase [Rhodospirillaceae bacterium]|tara:strand:- start:3148 stop:4173 length:1026 start_codon:yes stop_codon:yes gene_type:complete
MENKLDFIPDSKLKLMDQVRQVLRHYQYSENTEKIYCDWIVKYIQFFNARNYSSKMQGKEINMFLDYLGSNKKASPATQKQALNALIFLYQKVLAKKIPQDIKDIKLSSTKALPVVMSQDEVIRLFSYMKKTNLLMAKILYGCGFRLMECLRLRIQDVNFETGNISVRSNKKRKDRIVMLPQSIREELLLQKEKIREIHKQDLRKGYGAIGLPETISMNADFSVKSFGFQYLFAAKKVVKDLRTGKMRRHHAPESGLQKAVKTAARKAMIEKKISCQTFRHSFAAHLLENGEDIKKVQKLMGHSNLKMTKKYIKVMTKKPPEVISPLDIIQESISNNTGIL